MSNTNDIILRLKAVRNEKNLSYGDIMKLMEKNGDYLSKSTISRVFADDSENQTFRYNETIRPIAKALLDIENIEAADSTDISAMKSLLQFKIHRIEELEREIINMRMGYQEESLRLHEKMEREREQAQKNIDYFKEQLQRKEQRIDTLLEALLAKDLRYDELNIVLNQKEGK